MGELGVGRSIVERIGSGSARVWAALALGALSFAPLTACLGFGAGSSNTDPASVRTASEGELLSSAPLSDAQSSEAASMRGEEPRVVAANAPSKAAVDGPVASKPESAPDEPEVLGGGANGGESEDPAPTGDLRLDRGPGLLSLLVPRGEVLSFEVEIDLGALGDPTVGKVTLSSGAEPYLEGLPARGGAPKKSGKEAGWIKSTARGNHLGYELDHELYVRHLPRPMPRVLLTDTQKGSENRQRRLKLGMQDDKLVAVYEHDGHCKEKGCDNREHFVESKWIWGKPYHCEKCKKMEHRIWKEPQTRAIPPGTLDMLSAVYLARTMVREGVDAVTFPLIDKQKLWEVDLKRGKKTKTIEVPAGRFLCTQVQLLTRIPEGEPTDGEGFQGLFGIQGTIQIWMEASTGVPVLISGTLPVPVLGDLDVRVELAKFKGTPAGFGPLK